MFERRLYYHIDWALLIALLALCALGVAMIYSTTADPTRAMSRMYVTQLYAIVLGLVAMVFTLTLDYRTFTDKSHLIYIGLLALLLYVLFFGNVQMGARRWIALGGFNLQPSEFAKVGVALVLAKFFGENRGAPTLDRSRHRRRADAHSVRADRQGAGPRHGGDAAAGVPGGRLSRRDADAHPRHPLSWRCCSRRRSRGSSRSRTIRNPAITTFLDPSQDAKGAGYQQIQARITVGSGGLTGKGFKQGTQGQLRFLPVAHNDFIFSVLAEEQGFAGVLVALGLYLFVILRTLEAARLAKDRLGSYLVLGVLASFTFQVVYNITMSAGLAPVKGLTLPLMSYGGSSMIATLAGFGLVLNVRMRRFTN